MRNLAPFAGRVKTELSAMRFAAKALTVLPAFDVLPGRSFRGQDEQTENHIVIFYYSRADAHHLMVCARWWIQRRWCIVDRRESRISGIERRPPHGI